MDARGSSGSTLTRLKEIEPDDEFVADAIPD